MTVELTFDHTAPNRRKGAPAKELWIDVASFGYKDGYIYLNLNHGGRLEQPSKGLTARKVG